MSPDKPITELANASETEATPPQRTSPFISTAGWQLFWTVLSSLILDGGFAAIVFVRVSVAYWLGVLWVVARRRDSLTSSDRFYLRYGPAIGFMMSLPISAQLVDMAGPRGWMFLRTALGLTDNIP